jgi:hypothetical protein
VPLRTAGALHALVLDGSDATLAAAYPPAAVDDDTLWTRWTGRSPAMRDRILSALDRAPQTNEIRRSAILLPALWWVLGKVGDRPVALSELGASAGLNLLLDRFAIETPGRPARTLGQPRAAAPGVARRRRLPRGPARGGPRGRGPSPIDAGDPVDALRLMSYLWPDQPDRMAMTRGAIAMGPTRPDEGDAAPWLARRCRPRPGRLHVVYTTVAWQYFPPTRKSACTRSLETAGAVRPSDNPLAHVAFEADGRRDGGALTVRALAPCAAARDPCARRFSRPLGRLARLAIALLHGC